MLISKESSHSINEKRKGKERETTTARRVDKLMISFDVENRVARSGPADIYVIVTGPNGQVISDAAMGSGMLTTRTEGDKPFTFKTSVDYEQGTRKNIQVPLRQNDFQTPRANLREHFFRALQSGKSLHAGAFNIRRIHPSQESAPEPFFLD